MIPLKKWNNGTEIMIFIVDTNRIYNQGFAIAETISTD
jgi:hypothetical protein